MRELKWECEWQTDYTVLHYASENLICRTQEEAKLSLMFIAITFWRSHRPMVLVRRNHPCFCVTHRFRMEYIRLDPSVLQSIYLVVQDWEACPFLVVLAFPCALDRTWIRYLGDFTWEFGIFCDSDVVNLGRDDWECVIYGGRWVEWALLSYGVLPVWLLQQSNII